MSAPPPAASPGLRAAAANGSAAQWRADAGRRVQSLQARISAAILMTAVAVLSVGCALFMVEQHRAEQVFDHRVDQQLTEVLGAGAARALSAARTMPPVVPEPEAISRRSPAAMAGVVVSPTT